MEAKHYILTKIDGEYAYLTNVATGDEIFIALYLLPADADIGSRIKCEMFEYSLEEYENSLQNQDNESKSNIESENETAEKSESDNN